MHFTAKRMKMIVMVFLQEERKHWKKLNRRRKITSNGWLGKRMMWKMIH